MIGIFAPEMALKRHTARMKMEFLNSGYSHHGASRTKKSMIGWLFGGGSPDEDIIDNADTLRQRSRDLYMGGAALATGAIKTARTNIVGTGLRLKPSIDADFLGLSNDEAQQIKRTIEREFTYWAESVDCDAARVNNFYELQQLACLSQFMSGDCFALLPVFSRRHSVYDTRIRLIEADRCCDPDNKKGKDIKGGVEVNENAEVVAYWFVNQHPLGKSEKRKEWARVEAFGNLTGRRNVLHLMESERPEQRRGVPMLAPVIEPLKQLGRYTEAELMAAVVSGMFTVFIESESPETPLGQGINPELQVDDDDPNSYELGNGSIIGLAPGEKATLANPGRQNTAFDGFVTAVLRQVGAALEIPLELLVKHFTASYSASRGALLEAWKMFRMRRSWLASDFCQPIYEEWFTEAVAKGRIPAPGFFDDPLIRKAYTKAEWHGPSAGQLDPLKEATAAKLRVEEGFSTRERETAELTGGDFEMNHRQRVLEENMRRKDGLIVEGGENNNDQTQKVLESKSDDEE
ncbi:phage portal protein [Paenibacillus sp. UNC451MF]|uniref:phage portal protein n=1 Tax=Paenibacillus sp. UNC451MF TaxID=1449063 RepID=UPI001E4B8AA0|nr:phage portal protein [Paenibacillus sp. UNC451MF]